MNKLQALVPLLGWFYITILVFVVFSWFTRNKFGKIKNLYYVAFGLCAVFLTVHSLLDESKLYAITKVTLFSPFEQKAANDVGGYYDEYYVGLHPGVSRSDIIYLPDISQREFLYARMYLYPAKALANAVPTTRALTIIDTAQLSKLSRAYNIVKQSRSKSLVWLEEVK